MVNSIPKIILASSSPFRRELLARLEIPFECISPDIDESASTGESPQQLVERLSVEKAQTIANDQPNALVIGSDQVAVHGNHIVGKPRDHDHAVNQLREASGQTITLYTGLALINSDSGNIQSEVVPYSVEFRELSDAMIESYLKKEQPYNCAGSLKSEGLGITLLQRFIGDDPSTLIGLPLIRLIRMLEAESVKLV